MLNRENKIRLIFIDNLFHKKTWLLSNGVKFISKCLCAERILNIIFFEVAMKL